MKARKYSDITTRPSRQSGTSFREVDLPRGARNHTVLPHGATCHTAAGILVVLLVVVSMGCQSLRIRDRWFDSDKISKVPTEVLPIWTDTVLHQPGKPAVRGFGGRLYFYEEGKPDPVKVDGQVVVYVFDGDTLDTTEEVPLKKYIVTPDQLASHHSKTSLGNSYSIWIPWDQVGGPSRKLSLVTRLNGRHGGTVLSQPANKLLPGVTPNNSTDEEVELAGYSQLNVQPDSQEPNDEAKKMISLSIDLPPSFQRRLAGDFTAAVQTAVTSSAGSHAETTPGTDQFVESTAGEFSSEQNQQIAEQGDAAFESDIRPSPQRFPSHRKPRVQPGRTPLRRQPHPAGWPSALPLTPRNSSSMRTELSQTIPPSRASITRIPSGAE